MVAFSNSGGGRIYIGVNDSGQVTGLSAADIHRLNNLISNVASEGMTPSINPPT
jgi:ATP-dependent DNA helicase RecG